MNKLPSIRIRFHFTFSNEDVAFERLHSEMAEIATAFKDDKNVAAIEQRKHLQRIFLAYSNGGFTQPVIGTGNRAPELASQSDMKALSVLEAQDKNPVATTSSKAVVQIQSVQEEGFDPNGDYGVIKNHRRDDGSLKFGDLEID